MEYALGTNDKNSAFRTRNFQINPKQIQISKIILRSPHPAGGAPVSNDQNLLLRISGFQVVPLNACCAVSYAYIIFTVTECMLPTEVERSPEYI